MGRYLSLSYRLNDSVQAYGNGQRMKIETLSAMADGATSNNAKIQLPLHYGTHIDFPYHFSQDGKKSTNYDQEELIYSNVVICTIDGVEGHLIKPENIVFTEDCKEADFVIINTGQGAYRGTSKYWEFGLGMHKECAGFIKEKFPTVKAIGFDLISLNSYQERLHGRESHKEFLLKNDILIVEEMNLGEIAPDTKIAKLIVAPLWVEDVDGLPVTIIAECR